MGTLLAGDIFKVRCKMNPNNSSNRKQQCTDRLLIRYARKKIFDILTFVSWIFRGNNKLVAWYIMLYNSLFFAAYSVLCVLYLRDLLVIIHAIRRAGSNSVLYYSSKRDRDKYREKTKLYEWLAVRVTNPTIND